MHTAELILIEADEVRQIVERECWFEGERRHHRVDPNDLTVQLRVADIILRINEELLQRAFSRLPEHNH